MAVERFSLWREVESGMRDILVLCEMTMIMGPLSLHMQHWGSQSHNVEFVEKSRHAKILPKGMKVKYMV